MAPAPWSLPSRGETETWNITESGVSESHDLSWAQSKAVPLWKRELGSPLPDPEEAAGLRQVGEVSSFSGGAACLESWIQGGPVVLGLEIARLHECKLLRVTTAPLLPCSRVTSERMGRRKYCFSSSGEGFSSPREGREVP